MEGPMHDKPPRKKLSGQLAQKVIFLSLGHDPKVTHKDRSQHCVKIDDSCPPIWPIFKKIVFSLYLGGGVEKWSITLEPSQIFSIQKQHWIGNWIWYTICHIFRTPRYLLPADFDPRNWKNKKNNVFLPL